MVDSYMSLAEVGKKKDDVQFCVGQAIAPTFFLFGQKRARVHNMRHPQQEGGGGREEKELADGGVFKHKQNKKKKTRKRTTCPIEYRHT